MHCFTAVLSIQEHDLRAGNCVTAGKLHMTLIQLQNHPESPLLSLPHCKNSHIRRRPLGCLLSILPKISLYSNGASAHNERWSLARLLLSRRGSLAINRWLPSGWEEGGRECGKGDDPLCDVWKDTLTLGDRNKLLPWLRSKKEEEKKKRKGKTWNPTSRMECV